MHVVAERALNVLGIDCLAVVQAAEQGGDDFLGFLFAEILDEAVEKMLPSEGVVDFGFLMWSCNSVKYTTRYCPVYSVSL